MPIRILIADDHSVFRTSVRALLEKESDLEVVAEAADGFETIQAVADNEVDVLLLDLSMPGMTGCQVAETLLQERPRLAIVVLTMYEDEYYQLELLRLGVRAYVLKKSTGKDLILAIRAAYRGERYIGPSPAGGGISVCAGGPSIDERSSGLKRLTERERDVCRLLAYGHTNAEIAEQLSISERTVETHRSSIMAKLELATRADLVRFAIKNALLKLV